MPPLTKVRQLPAFAYLAGSTSLKGCSFFRVEKSLKMLKAKLSENSFNFYLTHFQQSDPRPWMKALHFIVSVHCLLRVFFTARLISLIRQQYTSGFKKELMKTAVLV